MSLNSQRKSEIYFDFAATTPLIPEVIEAMTEAMSNLNGNPSSAHKHGRAARAKVEQARKTIANYLQSSVGEIFFTSCATEANNMILRQSVKDLGIKRIISSKIEHHCILHTLEDLEKLGKVRVEMVELNDDGEVVYEDLERLLKEDVSTLVSLMHVNNEIGNILDLKRVGNLCKENNAFFHSDTAQSIGKFPFDLKNSNIHFLVGSSHKFHGPKGVGFVYINGDIQLNPFLTGGAQERNMRSGTENLHGIIGMERAIKVMTANLDNKKETIFSLKKYFKSELKKYFPEVCFNGIKNEDYQSPYILSVSFPAHSKNSMLDFSLDMAGVAISGGSACSSGSVKASHVLQQLKEDETRKTIRFSFSYQSNKQQVDEVILRLKNILV